MTNHAKPCLPTPSISSGRHIFSKLCSRQSLTDFFFFPNFYFRQWPKETAARPDSNVHRDSGFTPRHLLAPEQHPLCETYSSHGPRFPRKHFHKVCDKTRVVKETLHTARFICTRLSPSFKDPARRKDVTGFRDTAAVSTAGPPRPLGKQPRPCAGEAAASPAARGRLVPVCPAPRQHCGGQRPPRAPVPADPFHRATVPSTGRQSLPRARIQQALRACPPGDPDPDPDLVPGAHRPFVFASARCSTSSSAPAPGRRLRSLRSLSRNCHADRPLAGVHPGPPEHGIPRKVTQTPELRRPLHSIPGGTELWPARCRRPWKLL